MYCFKVKRLIDIVLSVIGIFVFAPILLLIVLAITADSEGPVIFKQKRVGKHKKHFHLLKFRTMRQGTPSEVPTHLLQNPEQHITDVGSFLRKTSLDEIPQIFNILVGHMSIVGPRPALWNQYDLIEIRDQYGVHDIRPGLTGLAQINGRDELPIHEKARIDGEYAKRVCILTDAKCFFKTLVKVLKRDGVVEGKVGSLSD